MMMHYHNKFGLKKKVQQFIRYWSDKDNWNFTTVTVTLSTAIQYFHWTLWLTLIYHQSKCGCIKISSSEDIAETDIFWLYISSHCDLNLEDRSPIFGHDIPAHDGAPHTKFGYKRLSTEAHTTGNKYLSCTLQPSPLKTPQWFPFCRQIMHHTT